jgi:hypothetical protein
MRATFAGYQDTKLCRKKVRSMLSWLILAAKAFRELQEISAALSSKLVVSLMREALMRHHQAGCKTLRLTAGVMGSKRQ